MTDYLMHNYRRLPLRFSHGQGAWLYDDLQQRYLDALCGVAVTPLGHAHPAITETLQRQAGRLLHCSNIYQIEAQQQLAEQLCKKSGMERAIFGNSGTEANEAAIKLSRLYGRKKGISQPVVAVLDGGFHGRSMGSLSASASASVQGASFAPLLPGFRSVPFDNIAALAELDDNTVAVLLEPIQGEGGIRLPQADYLDRLRTLCDQRGWLMMLDEVQTGIGRSGKWFAFEHAQKAQPDVMTLAKSLANGLPIGACLARGVAAELFVPGSHGSTLGGNPLCCQVALTVLDTIAQEQLLERVQQQGTWLLKTLRQRLQDHPMVQEIRGQGLLLGIELKHPCQKIVQAALQQGLLINVTATKTIRLLPPFILTEEQQQRITDILCPLIEEFSP